MDFVVLSTDKRRHFGKIRKNLKKKREISAHTGLEMGYEQ